jgi:fumarate hydratase subunit alpha
LPERKKMVRHIQRKRTVLLFRKNLLRFKKIVSTMRKILGKDIAQAAEKLIEAANFELPKAVQQKLKKLGECETEEGSKSALEAIEKNALIAPKERLPLCQDTGTAVFFVEIGHQVVLEEPIQKTLEKATRNAYQKYYLRKSIVRDPLFFRENTGDNCPPIIHIEQTEGENLKISFLAKGGGAENKSVIKMLRPADGKQGVINTIIEAAKNAGASSCPPWIVGIGIGGSFDSVASLAKRALLRPLGGEE